MEKLNPFPTVMKLAAEIGASWSEYATVATQTTQAEDKLKQAILHHRNGSRLLNSDVSLVLCGSFARHEMVEGSDYDWTLLVDGVVDNNHAILAREIQSAIDKAKLKSPGTSGTFGNMIFSHDLVHRIGGGADSNANLTRRILMLLESRPFSVSHADSSDVVWENVLGNILERYFEEDVHFTASKRRVPRFLLNDLTRYWRTICVDYAAKHWEQDGKKWAMRNAKLRFSRKLLYASGLAFCLACELNPPPTDQIELFGISSDESTEPFIERAKSFARTPPLEYLAAFVDAFIEDRTKRNKIASLIFGAYDSWLGIIGNAKARNTLEGLDHAGTATCEDFQNVRNESIKFAMGLELLFFNRDRDEEPDRIAKLTLQYIGF